MTDTVRLDLTSQPLNRVRREDRVVEDESWIKAMLRRAPYCALGMAWDGQPFVKPSLFALDEGRHAIYLHGAREGRTATNIEANPRVCLTVSEMGRLLPGSVAKGFALEYAAVVVFGRATILADQEEARHGLQLLLNKYFPHLHPGKDYRPILPEELEATNVYRVDIEGWSGKKREAATDFPGAFRYGDIPLPSFEN